MRSFASRKTLRAQPRWARLLAAMLVLISAGATGCRSGDSTGPSKDVPTDISGTYALADVGGNTLPYTPDYTAMFGGQLSRAVTSSISGYGRAEVVLTGAFHYDESNTQGQDAYSVVNIRGGARHSRFFGEVWLRNAFDTRYVPIAIPYLGFAPSGFIGENGRPRTFGVTIGAMF